MVKLDAMENPYALPEALRASIARIARDASINRYPDPEGAELKARLREAFGIPAAIELMLGNGSDELIQVLALAVARPGGVVLGVEPSFVMFRMISTFAGVRYFGVDLRDDFQLDAERLLAAIEEHQPALTFIAYPNNPTGNLFDETLMARVLEAAPGIVVVDEAYHAFAGRSFMGSLSRYPNLLVMRTVSKLGLAGLRLGALVGPAAWLEQLAKVRLPYNVNMLTQLVACEVLRHEEMLTDQASAIKLERGRLDRELGRLPGSLVPQRSRFCIVQNDQRRGARSQRTEKARSAHQESPRHTPPARRLPGVTVAPQRNSAFLSALAQTLAA